MAGARNYMAVDLGAESGRVMLGSLSGGTVSLREIHRFGNGPIKQDGSLRWDFERQFSEVKVGIGKAVNEAGGKVNGIGVDSWGVDFGLIGADGKLVENPYHYRDSRTDGILEKAFKLMPKRDIYMNTGIQFMQINSVYQLLAMRLANSSALAKTKRLLFIGDLFSYYLCGHDFGEYTLASTSQMMDMRTGQWSQEIFNKLSIPKDIMPNIVPAGTVVGKLSKTIAKELGCGQIPVIAVAAHDTGCAVAAVPASGGKWAYLSSGTWSLMGVEVPKAIINDKSFNYEFTNEGGVDNTIRLLKNIMGLWLIQECKRQWQSEGSNLSYGELTAMAAEAEPFLAHINCDYGGFLAPGDMPKRIQGYLTQTGQKTIEDKGQLVRIILESLALKYKHVMSAIEDITGQRIEVLHIVGGGIQNELLCQFAANALGKKVITGPIEATAIGNILIQAKAAGEIKTLEQVREVVRRSFEMKEYQPREVDVWEERYRKTQKA
jgi:sugar (pentulose or hexulose) kinase